MLKTVQGTETQIETSRKNKEDFLVTFSMIPIYNVEKTHSLGFYAERCIRRKARKEQLISELTQNNKDLKQFSYITSHNLRAPISNLTGLLNLIDTNH
jgi:hypothetical protein